MAVTGLILVGFVVGHLLGNLTVYLGPDWINAYAQHLRELGPFLWLARIALLAAVGLHIGSSVVLTLENRSARPIGYGKYTPEGTSFAARTMAVSGGLLFFYIVYHLLHFTFRVTHPEISHHLDAAGRHDVYNMVVLSFQNIYISTLYIVAMIFLCAHLEHGISSMFQSLGLVNEKHVPLLGWISRAFSVLLFIGYASIPFSIYMGWIKPVGVVS